MYVLESLMEYAQNIKKNKYMYESQRKGIDIFKKYIETNEMDITVESLDRSIIDKLVFYWFPRNKKYEENEEVYRIILTIGEIYKYIANTYSVDSVGLTDIRDIYAEEYKRIYTAKNMILSSTLDPVISINPLVVELDRYKNKKNKEKNGRSGITYIQSFFKVIKCKEGGEISLAKLDGTKVFKLLLEYPSYKYIKVGDIIHAVLRRKLFYIYWEFDEVRGYYLSEAKEFLKEIHNIAIT